MRDEVGFRNPKQQMAGSVSLCVTEPGFTTSLAASVSSGVVCLDSSNSLFLAVDTVFVCS